MARAFKNCAAVALLFGAGCWATAAQAGGFDRFDQGIELLFDPASIVIEAGAGYAFPDTRYSTVNGARESVPLLDGFWRPSFNVKFTPTKDTACLATARRPFGTDIYNGSQWSEASADVSTRLRVDELGLTCSYRVPVASGYVRAIAGGTRDFLEFDRNTLSETGGTSVPSSLEFSGATYSWRAGAAYEFPGFAAGVMYYAPINFDLAGNYTNIPVGGGIFLPNAPLAGEGSMPQAIEVSAKGVVGGDWLAGLSVKWMDWSELAHVPLYTTEPVSIFPAGTLATDLKTYFKDGWTVSGSLGHAVTRNVSALARVVYDSKTTTGWTEHVSSWSLLGGAIYKVNEHLDMMAGVGIIRLDAGQLDKKAEGAPFNATFDTSYAVYPFLDMTARF